MNTLKSGYEKKAIKNSIPAARALIFLLMAVCMQGCDGPGSENSQSNEALVSPSDSKIASTETEINTDLPGQQVQTDSDENNEGTGFPVLDIYHGIKGGDNLISGNAFFSPLGWNAEGAFGYIEIRLDEGRGGFSVRLRVADMISDEILVDEHELDWDHETVQELNPESHSAEILNYFINYWQNPLEANSLLPNAGRRVAELKSFPFESDQGIEYFTQVDIIYGGEDPAFDNIEAYDLWLRGTDQTAKLVGSRNPRAVAVYSAGYFLSPFENRIACLLVEERFTFEGTELFPVLMGSNMSFGFEPLQEGVSLQ